MSRNILLDAGLIIVVAVAGVAYLSGKKLEPQTAPIPAEETAPVKKVKAKTKRTQSASVVSIPKNPRDGQFWTMGRVNSGHVRFLVDTGASTVALTANDARKAGINLNTLKYNVPVSTAGGTNYAAYVKLDRVALGGITLRDIDALVIREGLGVSLLGMTFLGELQKVEATPNAMILRL